jgi:DNA polymerase ligase (LigD)-like protein
MVLWGADSFLMPRFVLLYHRCPADFGQPSHWDWMLEHGKVLWTWQLPQLPASWQASLTGMVVSPASCAPAQTVMAQKLPDHRLAYLEYEGPVSAGRGEVERCDGGTYELIRQENGRLEITVEGTVLRCTVELEEERLTVMVESRVESRESRDES